MTRPGPAELVAGVRRVLKDVVEPELTSDHARQRLAEVRAVLAQVDWDDAVLRLVARNAELRQALRDLAALDMAQADLPTREPPATYAVLCEQHREATAALIAVLPDLEERAGRDPAVAEVRGRLRALLSQG